MRRIILPYIVFMLLPVLNFAQMNEFQKEFTKVNMNYLAENSIKVRQHYLFSFGSANEIPFDSGYCYIEKTGLTMHSEFNGVELYSDGTFLIRISNPAKYMIVSKSNHSDSSNLGFIFKEGFSTFKKVEKQNSGKEISKWKLAGGTLGVLACEITFDTPNTRIINLVAELSPEHPFVSQIAQHTSEIRHVFIRIDYIYYSELNKWQPQLSDYIHVNNDVVTPAEKFKNYQIKFIK